MRARRTDHNHAQVREDLRAALPEASVMDLSGVGKGVPDLLVGWGGRNWLFEIKDPSKPPSKRKLTSTQSELLQNWQGQAAVVHSAAEAVAVIARILNDKNKP